MYWFEFCIYLAIEMAMIDDVWMSQFEHRLGEDLILEILHRYISLYKRERISNFHCSIQCTLNFIKVNWN